MVRLDSRSDEVDEFCRRLFGDTARKIKLPEYDADLGAYFAGRRAGHEVNLDGRSGELDEGKQAIEDADD